MSTIQQVFLAPRGMRRFKNISEVSAPFSFHVHSSNTRVSWEESAPSTGFVSDWGKYQVKEKVKYFTFIQDKVLRATTSFWKADELGGTQESQTATQIGVLQRPTSAPRYLLLQYYSNLCSTAGADRGLELGKFPLSNVWQHTQTRDLGWITTHFLT